MNTGWRWLDENCWAGDQELLSSSFGIWSNTSLSACPDVSCVAGVGKPGCVPPARVVTAASKVAVMYPGRAFV